MSPFSANRIFSRGTGRQSGRHSTRSSCIDDQTGVPCHGRADEVQTLRIHAPTSALAAAPGRIVRLPERWSTIVSPSWAPVPHGLIQQWAMSQRLICILHRVGLWQNGDGFPGGLVTTALGSRLQPQDGMTPRDGPGPRWRNLRPGCDVRRQIRNAASQISN
jgi:hypothetical protein